MEQQGKKGLAIASMVLGIVACVIAWWGLAYGIIGIVCAIVGLVLAILAQKSYKAIGQKNGMATAGLILSIIGLVLAIIGTIACGICIAAATDLANNPEAMDQLSNGISSALDEVSSSMN